MKKRFLAALLCLCMTLALLPTAAFAAVGDTFTYEGVTYKVTAEPSGDTPGTVWVGDGTDPAADAAITSYTAPETVTDGDGNKYTVTGVNAEAFYFYGGSAIKSIELPNATDIGDNAFDGCTALTSIELPNVDSVGKKAFIGCTKLASIELPKATDIGDYAFAYCTALVSVALPKATDIGGAAFGGCEALASVALPKATDIGGGAFDGCIALESVALPKATDIGESAFWGCTKLAGIELPNATNIGEGAFWGCTKLAGIELPNATNIGGGAFDGCIALESVILPKATDIGEAAFYGCTSLTSVTCGQMTAPGLGDGVVFHACPATLTVYMPGGATGYTTANDWPANITSMWSIGGTVKDAVDAPIEGATVTIGEKKTTTDSTGAYSIFMASANGVCKVAAKKGSEIGSTSVTVNGANITDADITLTTATPYTYNTPDSITVNGVTAMVSFDKASPQAAGVEVTATVTLTGTATAEGVHTINLNSTKANLSGTAQRLGLTAGLKFTSTAAPETYSFTVPAQAVDDLTLEHTFAAAGALQEQFTLPVGETYWFDLSGAGILNTGDDTGVVSIPDTTLHYVPFTYAGTVNAYSLGESSSGDAAASGNATPSLHSLFVADYAVTHSVSWNDLNGKSLIFGKSYASGNVNYTLRAPSAGSDYTGSASSDGSDHIGTPNTNEWDAVLNKGNGYIKNWYSMLSWGQDTVSKNTSFRAYRGFQSARCWAYSFSTAQAIYLGFRPVLEVLNPVTLTSDGLKAVTLNLNGGKVGNERGTLKIVYTGNSFTAPAKDGLTRPAGNTSSYFKWLGSNGELYAPTDAVPSTVTVLTAQWTDPHSHAWATTAWTTNATHHWHECEGVPAPCSITDNSLKDGYGAHTAGDWVIDTNATASTNGSKHKECTVCGFIMETATIPATGGGGSDPTYFYTLTFDVNGGSSISPARISEYTTVDLMLSKYIPTREGYEFTGWYSDKALTAKITSIRLTKNTTIYAGWEDKTNPDTGIDNPFTDVKDTDWFFEDVMFVYGNKLMVGTSATTFSPNDTTTRAMVATILWRMEGSPKVTGSSGFTDVSDGKYYTDAVTWAKQNGIVKGYSNTLFGPNEPVTREQLAAFFYRYAEFKGYDTTISGSISSFKDKDKVSDWAVDAMKWAVGYGVIQGKPGNLLDPQGDATRAQLAAMLHRLIEKTSLWQA